jgi:hypothetical protein
MQYFEVLQSALRRALSVTMTFEMGDAEFRGGGFWRRFGGWNVYETAIRSSWSCNKALDFLSNPIYSFRAQGKDE